ncbi:hypothetical protein [Butyrivibrio sp. AE3004]|uniref:hypothetical protein n=1 Tax=Butyrivibrio sp. AE3004 TaxID=1506994 RepID=UPI000A85A7C8|nr:hypothetical protein [Butyrivibrio sp. AE3004]
MKNVDILGANRFETYSKVRDCLLDSTVTTTSLKTVTSTLFETALSGRHASN